MFGRHQFDLMVDEVLTDRILSGHFEGYEMRFWNVDDCLSFLRKSKIILLWAGSI